MRTKEVKNISKLWEFCAFLGFSLFLLSATVYGQTQTNNNNVGEIGASFLSGTPSVRLMSLGGNQAALGGGIETAFSNPAGMMDLEIPEFYFSHNESFFNTRYDSLFFGIPLKRQVLSIGAQYINDGEVSRVGVDANNNPITNLGQFRFATQALHISYAKELAHKLDVGLTAKGWSDQQDGTSTEGWAADFGLRIKSILPSLDVGISQRNLGPRVDNKPLPRSFAVGAAYHHYLNRPQQHRFSLSTEVDLSPHQDPITRIGLEYDQRYVSLRTGFQNSTNDLEEALTQFTFGGGLRIKGWKLDYTWVPRGELEDEHRVALSIGIGLTSRERLSLAKKLDDVMNQRIQDKADSLFTKGQEAMDKGEWSVAVENFKQALEWDSDNQNISDQLKIARSKNDLHQATLHYEQGVRLAKNKDWLEAALMWEKTLMFNPHHKQAKLKLKRSRRIINRRLKKANKKTNATKLYQKGVHHFIKGKPQKALDIWEEALKINPKIPNIKEYMEKAKRMTAETKLAKMKIKSEDSRKQVDRMAHEAFTLYTLGQTKGAIKLWEEILVLDPDNEDAKIALKDAQEKEQLVKNNDQESLHKRAVHLNAKALTAYAQDDLKTSIRIWREALRLDPGNRWIKNNLKRVEAEVSQDIKGNNKHEN